MNFKPNKTKVAISILVGISLAFMPGFIPLPESSNIFLSEIIFSIILVILIYILFSLLESKPIAIKSLIGGLLGLVIGISISIFSAIFRLLPSMATYRYLALIGFFIGAIIGFIIQKIKEKRK